MSKQCSVPLDPPLYYLYLHMSILWFLAAQMAMSYVEQAKDHADEFLPFGTAYQEGERVGAIPKV